MLSKRVLARIALLFTTSVVMAIVGSWLLIRRDLAATRAAVRASAKRDVPMTAINAFIAAEDPCHWKHHRTHTLGAVAGIFLPYDPNSAETEMAGHASLANQLVRQHVNGRGLSRQTREVFITAVVEATENPATVARAYVNSVYLGTTNGEHIYGVTDAAQRYYGKRVSQLNLAQCVVLAASVRSPHVYSPHVQSKRAIARRLSVLTRLRTSGLVSHQDSESVERSLRSTAG